MKSTLKATKDHKTVSSVYIIHLSNTGNDTYIRKYFFDVPGGTIFCSTLSLVNSRCDKTTLTDINDISSLKQYDNNTYGDMFND